MMKVVPSDVNASRESFINKEELSKNQVWHYNQHYADHKGHPRTKTLELMVNTPILSRLKLFLWSFFIIISTALGMVASTSCDVTTILIASLSVVLGITVLALFATYRVVEALQKDDDGIETIPQRILQAFVHVVGISMTMFILPPSIILSMDKTYVCTGDSSNVSIAASAFCIISFVVFLIAAKYCIQIITWYEFIQSFQELACLWMTMGAGMLITISIYTENKQTFLNSDEITSSNNSKLPVEIAWGALTVFVSLIGFFSGWTESPWGLKFHAFSTVGLLIFAIIVIALNASVSGVAIDTVNTDCASIMRYMGRQWFESYFGCGKYSQSSSTNFPANTITCDSSNVTAVYWEFMEENKITCALGCIDDQCCARVRSSLYVFTNYIIIASIWYLLIMITGMWSSFLLIKHARESRATESKSLILRHSKSGFVASLLAVSIALTIAVSIGIGMGVSISTMPVASQIEMCNFEANVTDADTSTVASCFNGIMDGSEEGIDCGGTWCSPCSSSTTTPTGSSTSAPTFAGGPGLLVKFHSADSDTVDLMLKFMATGEQMCAVGPIADVNNRCGGATHNGKDISDYQEIEVDNVLRTNYVILLHSNTSITDVQGYMTIYSQGMLLANTSLPVASNDTAKDLHGYLGDSIPYTTNRVMCFNAAASVPTLYDCSQLYLEGFEYRATNCLWKSSLVCGIECAERTWMYLDLDRDGYGDSSKPIETCQASDDYVFLSSNSDDCDDTRSDKNPSLDCFLNGWYINSMSTRNNCNEICSSYNLQCDDATTSSISSTEMCQNSISQALQSWCSYGDTEYSVSSTTLRPRSGGVYQLGVNSNQASCMCQNGVWNEPKLAGITLNGSHFQTLKVADTYTELGATCDEQGYTLIMGGESVDTSAPGTYVVTYTCCDSSSHCSGTDSRQILVDHDSGDCNSFLDTNTDVYVESVSKLGGCSVFGQLNFPMNNNPQGFPIPTDEFYFLNSGTGKCSERPSVDYARRVCYCTL